MFKTVLDGARLRQGHNDQSHRDRQCSETMLTRESQFHISTPQGIWTRVPCDWKQTGSPLDQWDMVRMRWDCRFCTTVYMYTNSCLEKFWHQKVNNCLRCMSYNNCCNKNVKWNQLSSHDQSLQRERSIIVSSIAVVDPGNLSSSSSGLTVVATGEGNTHWREFEAL